MGALVEERTWACSSALLALLLVIGAGCMTGCGSSGDMDEPALPERAPAIDPGPPAPRPPMPLDPDHRHPVVKDPEPGATAFVSADAAFNPPNYYGEEEEEDEKQGRVDDEAEDEIDLEEGDIYRVLGPGWLLNLHVHRGLQVIDVSDPASPTVAGRLPLPGHGVEIYVIDESRAVVLLNQWLDMAGRPEDVVVEKFTGGAAVLIDISTPTAPRILAQAPVDGDIRTSRMAHQGDQHALYIASVRSRELAKSGTVMEHRTSWITSFDVHTDGLVEQSRIELDGYASHIQVDHGALMVAREPASSRTYVSETDVTLIDITDPGGAMVLGDTVTVPGLVRSRFCMGFYNDQLRVLSGQRWGRELVSNHLATWDATDRTHLVPIDEQPFAAGAALFSAMVLDDRALAVTHRQIVAVDPFYAFAIDAGGHIEDRSAIVVPDRNDFMRPVLDGTRLLGIDIDDEDSSKLAVSLYDIADLTNPNPRVTRTEVAGGTDGWQWSQAWWELHRFTVLDDAVRVQAPSGETETGLVLLPFMSRQLVDGAWQQRTGVQIVTFSSTTVTRRGIMEHGSQVQRTFLSGAGTLASLSTTELAIHDPGDVDHPVSLGRVWLAMQYEELISYGDVLVRRTEPGAYEWWLRAPSAEDVVDIIARGEPVETATPLARLQVPDDALLTRVGNLLVVVEYRYIFTEPWHETYIDVYDLSEPTAPVHVGQLVSDQLPPPYDDYRADVGYVPALYGVGDALVLVGSNQRQRTEEVADHCNLQADNDTYCYGEEGCTYPTGRRECHARDGAWWCLGALALCTDHEDGETTCEEKYASELDQITDYGCRQRSLRRRWNQYELYVVSLADPSQPTLAPVISLPAEDESLGVVADGDGLYVSFKRQATVPDDPRPHARYFVQRLDLSDPAQPALGPEINVPGELLAVQGNRVFTRDRAWGHHVVEDALAALELDGAEARLLAYRRFADRHVTDMILDQRGLAVVTHNQIWYPYAWQFGWLPSQRLTVLGLEPSGSSSSDPGDLGWQVLSEMPLAPWADLRQIAGERALFQTPGGTLVFDLQDPRVPMPQAYLPRRHTEWYARDTTLVNGALFISADYYGIYEAP